MKRIYFISLLFIFGAFVCGTTSAKLVVIKPYYGDYNKAWTFDGKVLKPYYGGYVNAW